MSYSFVLNPGIFDLKKTTSVWHCMRGTYSAGLTMSLAHPETSHATGFRVFQLTNLKEVKILYIFCLLQSHWTILSFKKRELFNYRVFQSTRDHCIAIKAVALSEILIFLN